MTKTTKFDFSALLVNVASGNERGLLRIETADSPVGVFCGFSEGRPQLAFLTKTEPIRIPATSAIEVSQWKEAEGSFWTSFVLQDARTETQFNVLAGDLIATAVSRKTEHDAMHAVRNCLLAWRIMFRPDCQPMSDALYKGLFGELLFLKTEMIPLSGVSAAVGAWSGPDMTAKDFSFGDNWWEIKTIGAASARVSIASIEQLSSNLPGTLVVVRTERMSDEFDNGCCMVGQLFSQIFDLIEDNDVQEEFLRKVESYGYTAEADKNRKMKIISIRHYDVKDGFPRIRELDVPHQEILSVSYDISLPGIKPFCKD
jgi:hypothetical protein